MGQSVRNFDAVQKSGAGEMAYAVFLVCFVFTVIPLVFVLMLLFYHSFLIGLNTTTWEHRRRANINYMRVYSAGEYPFNGGVIDNYGEVCCHGEKLQVWKAFDTGGSSGECKRNPRFSLCDNRCCHVI